MLPPISDTSSVGVLDSCELNENSESCAGHRVRVLSLRVEFVFRVSVGRQCLESMSYVSVLGQCLEPVP